MLNEKKMEFSASGCAFDQRILSINLATSNTLMEEPVPLAR